MPDTSGMTLGRKIKADPKLRDTILVMLTSAVQRGDVERAREAGFAAYLAKPIKQSQLFDCLRNVIGLTIQKKTKKTVPSTVPQQLNTNQHNQNLRILLAEDNAVNQKLALHILGKKFGCHVDTAINGNETVELLSSEDYDIVLMDCQMPEMDGYEATRIIRNPSSPVRNHRIPIIAMTANAMKGDREECIAAGMDDYIAKPVMPQELVEAIERNLSRNKPSSPKDGKTNQEDENKDVIIEGRNLNTDKTSQNLPEETPFDLAETMRRVEGDGELLTELVELFLQDAPKAMKQITQAIDTSRPDKLVNAAHSLKGIVNEFGAKNAYDLSLAIETAGRNEKLEGIENTAKQLETEVQHLTEELRQFLQIHSDSKQLCDDSPQPKNF